MKRIFTTDFLSIALALLVFGIPGEFRGAEERRLNVLMIVADDLNTSLGCYGDKISKTPHLDKLATSSLILEQAHCQYAVCNPSRISFLSGLYPYQTQVYINSGNWKPLWPDIQALPAYFKSQGYHTARIGKVYHQGVPTQIGSSGQDHPSHWDYAVNPTGRDKFEEDCVYSLTGDRNLGTSLSWLAIDAEDSELSDGSAAREAVSFLEEQAETEETPFLLCVGFFRPHTPFVAPQRYFDRYPLSEISVEDVAPDELDDVPAGTLNPKIVYQNLNASTQRLVKQAYYASVSYVDAQVGTILDVLKQTDLEESTVVVFVSDHGYHLGDHFLWMKASLFSGSTRVPLIIRVPGVTPSGARSSAVCELVDLYPTLVDICGLPRPDHLAGVSLWPLLEDSDSSVKTAALTEFRHRNTGVHGRSIVTERFRYTEWDKGATGRELYDLRADPGESVNQAANLIYKAEILRLSNLLRDKLKYPTTPSL